MRWRVRGRAWSPIQMLKVPAIRKTAPTNKYEFARTIFFATLSGPDLPRCHVEGGSCHPVLPIVNLMVASLVWCPNRNEV